MRKVKVAAAFLCLLSYGMLHGGIAGTGISVAKADQCEPYLEEAKSVTTTASIETTSIVTTATTTRTTARPKTTAAVRTTTAAVTTAPMTTTTVRTTVKTTAATTAAPVSTSAAQTTTVQLLSETSVQETVTTSEAASTAPSTQATTAASSTEAVTEVTANASRAIQVSDREYCMLCNVVGHEYGSDWVPEAEKALVVEVVMNRVNSPLFPNTIYEVLTQRNQFSGLESLIEMDGMSGYVTESVKAAVDLYLSDPSQFNHGYLYFNGDGTRNYFRTAY